MSNQTTYTTTTTKEKILKFEGKRERCFFCVCQGYIALM